MIKKILGAIRHPVRILQYCSRRGWLAWMSDERYLKLVFKMKLGKKLDLEFPKTFNEKLQWLKLYDRKPEYTMMVDKYEVRAHIAERLGEEYLIPLLGVWNHVEDIDYDSLPDQFVLKCTHDSGSVVICNDKSQLDKKAVAKRLLRCLKNNGYGYSREWPYKDVKPRIIAEEYMKDAVNQDLPVYKFFCFGGEPKIIQVIQNDKHVNESIDYFDTQWNLLDMRQNFPNSPVSLKKPENLEKMLELASTLSKDRISFIRIDLYEINGKVYFSEYTFFSDAGIAQFHPETWDEILGEWIVLPPK